MSLSWEKTEDSIYKVFKFWSNIRLENCLLVFDDSCEKIFNDKEFSKLAPAAGRHKNLNVVYVKQNLFQQS